jgi:hypothetical protein
MLNQSIIKKAYLLLYSFVPRKIPWHSSDKISIAYIWPVASNELFKYVQMVKDGV